VVDYGVEIPKISAKIQASVKKAVETMTGLRVIETNVHIQGVRILKEDSEEGKRVH
jgi:uncharacterized alkaline shock family protein YloU